MNRITILIVLCLCCLAGAMAQTAGIDRRRDTLRQLLAEPAPTPHTSKPTEEVEPLKERPPSFFDRDKAPPDHAPIEDLLEYWNRNVENSTGPLPTGPVKQRLLEACAADPEMLARFLPLLPPTEAAAKAKEYFDKQPSNAEGEEYWRDKLRKWLLFNSRYFLSELVTLASKVRDDEQGGYVDQSAAVSALAKVDWESAEPLLKRLVSSGQPRSKALALTLFYNHAIVEKDPAAEDRYRADLQAIAADRNALAGTRDAAIEALSLSEWSGRDEWYLALFPDETLVDATDGSTAYSPLNTLFANDPDKWIPVMTRLVESKDLAVRSAAANCLIIFQNQEARKDALQPLLPWLSNPDWAKDKFQDRLRLIQSMHYLDLPESVPGLIWEVDHDETDSYERSYAAESLATYKDPRAVPALKKALASEKGEDHRRRIIQGLLACQGLTETEQVEALEAFANKLTTAAGRAELEAYRSSDDDPLPLSISIGSILSQKDDVPASVVQAVLARAAFLQKTNPSLARSLLEVAHRWQGRQIDLDLIQRIADGTADAAMIVSALQRRTQLRENVGPELQSLVGRNGAAPGIAAVLLADPLLAQSVLGSGTPVAQLGLLVCARLTQMILPVDSVGAFLPSKDQLLALAAERYLLAEDSKTARELLWASHKQAAFITGWRENRPMLGGSNFEAMGKAEEKLRAELFSQDGVLETYALVANAEQQHSRVLRVYPNKAVYTYYEDPARYRERVISREELSAFKKFLANSNLEDLGPQFGPCHHDCWTSELLVLTKEKGRRVFSQQGYNGWADVVENFDLLGKGENARTHYNLEKVIEGLEVLYANKALVVKDVWQRGAEVRILVERERTREEQEQWEQSYRSNESEDDAARAERRRQEEFRQRALFSWRALANHGLGEATTPPEGYLTFDESKFPPDLDESETDRYGGQSQPLSRDFRIIARNFSGLWRQTAGQQAVRISGQGAYASPIVTPDGKWVIVAKTDGNWGQPNYVVRFNLETGLEYRVDVPAADQLNPIAYLAPHGKILLLRAKDDDYESSRNKSVGPDKPEYYLLDAATGQTTLTSGVFAPLLQEGKRFLQAAGRPNEFWAAIPDETKNQTRVGRYNLKDFSFQLLLTLPLIRFESMSMWVDESGAKLYVVYQGQLLRLPLRAGPGTRQTRGDEVTKDQPATSPG